MHTLRSRFRARSYFQFVLWLLTAAMIAGLAYFANGQFWLLGLVPLFIFLWLWIWYELRKKAIKILIGHNSVTIAGFYGLGKKRTFAFSEISGYRSMHLSSENGDFQYLFLYAGEKRVACISAYHHRNFNDMSNLVSENFKDLGPGSYDISREIRELFR